MLKDLALPVAVVAIVGMMIFPLPCAALDVLLMCNIALALSLLLSAVYLIEPERFTVLPTILLLSTLFRLALNIATTRQLLGSGTAPGVVTAFGDYVVGGNLVVGAVVFAILTLVQFMVVAKGAERVAEVAARFTLDAMPGKQMAIDADIRAGLISLVDAREKRLDLHRESKLYGSLDGAMKFVKGDAIAGLLITVLNIVAGLIVGVTQQGLSIADAAHKYTIFTVGDGLVSQIPALLIAVAAGIAVTRVSDKDGSLIGTDVFTQLGREPQALGTTAAILVVLALIPEMPVLPFLAMGGLFGYMARQVAAKRRKTDHVAAETEFRPQASAPVSLRLSPLAAASLRDEALLPRAIPHLRDDVFSTWGIVVPEISFSIAPEMEGCVIEVELLGAAVGRSSDIEGRTLTEVAVDLLRDALAAHKRELMNDTHTRMLLEIHQPTSEDLINSVIPRYVTVTALTSILRDLIEENVAIRQLPLILQAMADLLVGIDGETPGAPDRLLLMHARISLQRTITRSIASPENEIVAIGVEPRFDHLIARLGSSDAPVDPDVAQMLAAKVSEVAAYADCRNVVVVSKGARRMMFRILSSRLPDVTVIAPEEIGPGTPIRIAGVCGTAKAENDGDDYAVSEAA